MSAMKPYQYGMEPDVEMRVLHAGVAGGAAMSINGVVVSQMQAHKTTTYYGWQWAIVHGSRLTASGSGKDEAEAYRETCDAFNLGLKMISEAN